MIEFKKRPPTRVSDVNLSESGKYLLADSPPAMARAYGRAALSEIIDGYGDRATLAKIRSCIYRINEQAQEIIPTVTPGYARVTPRDPFAASSACIGFRQEIGIENGERGLDQSAILPMIEVARNQGAVTA